MSNKNMKITLDLELALLIYFSLFAMLPSLSNSTFYIPLLAGIAYMVFINLFAKNNNTNIYLKYVIIIVYISLLYTFFVSTSTIAVSASNRIFKRFLSKVYQYYMMFFPVFAMTRAIRMERKKRLLLILVNVICMLFVMRTSLAEISINVNATRSWGGEVSNANVAGYYFVYAVPFLFITLSYMALNTKRLWARVIAIIFAAYCFIFLINAQYTLSILVSLIGLYLLLFIKYRKTYLILLFSIFTIVLIILLPNVLAWLASVIDYSSVSTRLLELSDSLRLGSASGYNLEGRFTLYKKTIVAFLSSPVWGNRNFNVDGHSTFLMILADLGLIGAIPFFALIKQTKTICYAYVDDRVNFNVLFIAYILMGLTNPVHSSSALSWSLWFICPLIFSIMYSEENFNGKMEY